LAPGKRLEEAVSIARDLGRHDSRLLEACAELFGRLDRCVDAGELLAAAMASTCRFTEPVRLGSKLATTPSTTCRRQLDQMTLASGSELGPTLDWAAAVNIAVEVLRPG
jgi:hypothetical protein